MTDAALSTDDVEPSEAVSRASRLVGVAFDLLLEDETTLTQAGRSEEIALGRWLTRASGTPRQSAADLRLRLQATVEAMVRSYFVDDRKVVPEIVHVQALAAVTLIDGRPVERTTLLRGWAPRAQLLVPLVAALLSAEDRLPPLGAWGFSSHADLTGEDADAYGVHKEPGLHASERLLSLDVLGGDARAAVAMLNLVTGMRDAGDALQHDPRRRAEACAALAPFGIAPPSDPADHLAILLGIARATHDLLNRAAQRRSRVLRLADISASRLCDLAVPTWATAGQLRWGPHRGRSDLRAPQYWPGTDSSALQAATAARLPLLALAFDSATIDGGEVPGLERLVLGERMLAGRQLAELLRSAARDELPSVRGEPPAALRALSGHRLAARLALDIDPETTAALTLARGRVVLSDPHGAPTPAAMVLQSVNGPPPAGTLAWASNASLALPDARNQAIIVSALHRRALAPGPPLGECSKRLYKVFALHEIKSGSYSTRCYLRVLAMLANLVLVAEGRAAQAVAA